MPRLKRRVSRAPRVEALELRALLSSTAMSSAVSGALRVDADAYNPSQILVRYRTDGPVVGPLPLVLAGADLDWEVSAVPGLRQVELTPGWGVHEALAAYRADPRVLYAEPDFVVRAEAIPNDPRFNQQWGLDNTNVPFGGLPDADIDAPQAWDVTTGNPNTIVAVIDTGVDFNHPDLAANIWTNTREIAGNNLDDDVNGYVDDINGYDFVNNDGSPLDDNSHGTHVAGIIGASGNNAVGIAGVARDVRIMALKFLDASGSGYISAALSALNYAVANGATISNNSWGGGPYSQAMADAIRNAGDRGHIFVAAAGNSGSNIDTTPSYPASYNFANVVAVAATNVSDQLAGFSNFGPVGVHLGAPGQDILSTIPNGGYGFKSGTSMAAPMVSGVFALVRGQHPEWSNGQVISQVLSTVDPVPGLQGKVKNAGRVNAARAVGADIAGASVTTSTPTGTVNGPVGSVRLRFNEAINPSSFTTADVIDISGPAGALAATGVSPVAGSGNFEFDVTFAPQSAPGSYRLTVGPDILDLVGNRMDQDGDGINGEVPGDRYTAGFTIAVATGGGDGLAATYYDDKEFAGAVLNRIDPTVDFNWGNGSPDPSMGPDDYSARWTGQVLAQFDETYNFSTFSDDGVRLWVDGRLLIDNWTEHAPTENNGAIALLAGRKYAIRMEYFEGGGGAVARLRWSSPSTPKTAIPKTQLFSDSPPTVLAQTPTPGESGVATIITVSARFSEAIDPATINAATFTLRDAANATVAASISYDAATQTATLTPSAPLAASTTYTANIDGGPGGVQDRDGTPLAADFTWSFTTGTATAGGDGLAATYYDDKDFLGSILNRIDPTVDFNWGNGSPDPSMGPDDYSARWTGQVLAQFDETYTFSTFSDDGVRLWVDGRLLIDNWTEHAPTENNGAIALLAGRKYAIRMEYFEGGGGAVARLRWSSPSTPKTAIPKTQLFSDSAPTQSTFNATGSPVVTGASQEFVTAASSEEATPSGLAAPGELSPAGFNVVTLPTEAIPSPLIGRAIDEVLALSDPADSRQASAMFASRADRWGRPGADQPVVVSEPLGMDIPWAWDLAVARKKRGASLWGGR